MLSSYTTPHTANKNKYTTPHTANKNKETFRIFLNVSLFLLAVCGVRTVGNRSCLQHDQCSVGFLVCVGMCMRRANETSDVQVREKHAHWHGRRCALNCGAALPLPMHTTRSHFFTPCTDCGFAHAGISADKTRLTRIYATCPTRRYTVSCNGEAHCN